MYVYIMATGLRSNQEASETAHIVSRVNALNDSTSEFNRHDIARLRVVYINVDSEDRFKLLLYKYPTSISVQSPLYISNIDYNMLVGCSKNKDIVHNLPDKEKQFAILIDHIALNEDVIQGTDESKTDTFVDYVLREIGLADYPLTLKLQPLYELIVRHKRISSVYDFSVEKDGTLLLVEEDKHIRNASPGSAWGEYQIAGEILAGAYSNYIRHSRPSDIIAMRVIGTRFTFYHSSVPLDYLDSLAIGLPETDVTVIRYPSQVTEKIGLDYKIPDERKAIIDILQSIRYRLSSG